MSIEAKQDNSSSLPISEIPFGVWLREKLLLYQMYVDSDLDFVVVFYLKSNLMVTAWWSNGQETFVDDVNSNPIAEAYGEALAWLRVPEFEGFPPKDDEL